MIAWGAEASADAAKKSVMQRYSTGPKATGIVKRRSARNNNTGGDTWGDAGHTHKGLTFWGSKKSHTKK